MIELVMTCEPHGVLLQSFKRFITHKPPSRKIPDTMVRVLHDILSFETAHIGSTRIIISMMVSRTPSMSKKRLKLRQ
jgi:hypothetical protein